MFFADRKLNEDVNLNASFGGNKLRQDFERLQLSGSDFSIPGLETISNASQTSTDFEVSRKEINSLYGSAELAYKNYLFLKKSLTPTHGEARNIVFPTHFNRSREDQRGTEVSRYQPRRNIMQNKTQYKKFRPYKR